MEPEKNDPARPNEADETQPVPRELNDEQLENVAGGATSTGGGAGKGKANLQDFHFTKLFDKSSTSL